MLGSILYLLYTCDILLHDAKIATFADDTAMLVVSETIVKATETLQQTIDNILGNFTLNKE